MGHGVPEIRAPAARARIRRPRADATFSLAQNLLLVLQFKSRVYKILD
jgi:hypothetical protein